MPAETFRFLAPTNWPLSSGDPISLEVCDSNWGSSGFAVRVDHTVKTFPPPADRKSTRLVSYEIGGTGAAVFVRGPWSAGYPAYGANDPAEWTFSILKAGGGPINTGDTVSIRINSNWGKTFFFRSTGTQDQAEIDGDGTPGQAGTLFIVEFNEVRSGVGWRPPMVQCQSCAIVTAVVTSSSSGLPVRNATVNASGVLENHAFTAISGINGRAMLTDSEGRSCIPAGNISLQTSADRYQTKTVAVTVPGSGSIDVAIQLDCTEVRGTVVDTANLPVAGVTVFLLDSSGNPLLDENGNPYLETTDANGKFVFKCVPHGQASVWTPDDPSHFVPINIPPEGLSNVKVVIQVSCGNVVGTVTDAVTGQPISGAAVTVVGSTSQATTNATGNFTLMCVKPGGMKSITASAPCHSAKIQSVIVPTSGNSLPVNFQLQPVAVVELVIRLGWGLLPSDLDAHLSGPDGMGGRFHLFFGNRTTPPVSFADLDNDITTGTGPENITIRRSPAVTGTFVAGEYRYWVHNYNRTTFQGSNAVVTILGNGAGGATCKFGTYLVLNANGNQNDPIWHVADITIDASGNIQQVAVIQTLQQGDQNTVL